jgi:hypothetical protein
MDYLYKNKANNRSFKINYREKTFMTVQYIVKALLGDKNLIKCFRKWNLLKSKLDTVQIHAEKYSKKSQKIFNYWPWTG